MRAGNRSTHLRKLEDAGYVEVTTSHQGCTPVTWVALTIAGRRAFGYYSAAVRRMLGG